MARRATKRESAKHVTPQILGDKPPSAEVVVGARAVHVTVALPDVPAHDLDVFLTRQSIRVRRRDDPTASNYAIPLPVSVEPERYVMWYKNGVFDFVIERASR